MGGCSGGGSFKSTDWREGINKIIEEAEDYYGHQEGYSGAANSCEFRYLGDKSKLSKKELEKYIDGRMDMLGNGDGEVVNVGIVGYYVIKTKVEPARYLGFDTREVTRGMQRPAILVEERHGYPRKIAEGTQAELKQKVHQLLRSCNYNKTYYILTRKASYLCSGDIKEYKTTKQKTTDKQLVLPVYKFEYYGWYRS